MGSCFNFEDFCTEHNIILRIEKTSDQKSEASVIMTDFITISF